MKNFFIFSIFLFFNTYIHSFTWDNKHFAKYTSNALANTALAYCCTWNACYAYEGRKKSGINGSITIPGSIALTIAYIGYEKYKINQKKHPDTNILKASIHTCTDTILLLTGVSGMFNNSKPQISALCSILYLCKYTYFNRPQSVNTKKNTN